MDIEKLDATTALSMFWSETAEYLEDFQKGLDEIISKFDMYSNETGGKPLKDWTLGEVKSFCTVHDRCDGCALERKSGGCKIADEPPCEWNLGEKRRFTVQEAEKAMAFKTLYPKAHSIYRAEEWIEIDDADGEEERTISIDLAYDWFPSIKIGERVKIEDIIGGAER